MFAIHTVFILKENILFLEEWICYHILIGFDKFYLYDNSKCQVPGDFDLANCKELKLGKINKYGIKYDELVKLSDLEIRQTLSDILQKYKDNIILVEWSPLNNNGYITYGQELAHDHCLKKLKEDKIDWCANIDMDEFIVIQNIKEYIHSLDTNISNVKLSQIRFESRFRNIGKLIINIKNSEIDQLDIFHSNKNIYRVDHTNAMGVHTWRGNGVEIHPSLNEIWFNHYKLNVNDFRIIDNINPILKNGIEKESKKFILNKLEQHSKQ